MRQWIQLCGLGVSGSRVGTSMTGGPAEPGAPTSTVRAQSIAPGYTIGVGVVASELLDSAGLDLGLLVHSAKFFGRFDTWVEMSLGISIP